MSFNCDTKCFIYRKTKEQVKKNQKKLTGKQPRYFSIYREIDLEYQTNILINRKIIKAKMNLF